MSNFVVEAVSREDQGKGASRRLRHEGLVPGVVYGSETPVSISMINKDLIKQLSDETFFSSILTLKIDGKEEKVIIKDLQRHPAKLLIMHADFQRVVSDQKIKITVPLQFANFEKSAASKAAAKFAAESNVVEVLCLPENLPEALVVDLTNVEIGQTLHLSDISMPEGVEVAALRRGGDHNQGIGYIYSPRGAK
ncbi:50S ribosomal protein L25/general stress protein Ctc [Neptunomonas japonica]|uniref:Large ribosomal subunit protein bL25 n=1 Tax=Neptunomonas japonica JAMM 1380 TaxID=1441457 RepID=A0A7R6SWX9_9GAMM|nr:50S ribosomal protein L25/general stress protein Ctc [Neptunomonas japonica]BBB31169.1 large subunit ribosomal protein L25 [Neptunomonas japonica JAMM 1380]